MFDQIRFYLSHSLNDLRTNKRLTFFALLSIATGVAAIISLQTLSIMIGDTLQRNLQESNRGDVSATIQGFGNEEDAQRFVESGLLIEEESSLFGQPISEYYLSEQGLTAIQDWINSSRYAGSVELTTSIAMTSQLSFITGAGRGNTMTDQASGEQLTQLQPIVIDSSVYPYYNELRTLDGTLLADALASERTVVINDTIARDLELAIGDTVLLSGATESFTVSGIIQTEAEIKNPGEDIFSALFGFYITDQRNLTAFEDNSVRISDLYFKLDDPQQVTSFENDLQEAFPLPLSITTTEDIRLINEQISKGISNLMTVIGLVALLLGSIGIINTMQVVVRRRTLEIAVLKTLGLQAEQVTLLFLTQALLMGIIGSILGILLGWALTFLIKGSAETVFGAELPFRIALTPVLNGLLIGTVVTTAFGFLPTLTAGQVRPGLVLRPTDAILPPAGKRRSALVLVLIIIVIAFIAQGSIGSLQTAFLVVIGAFSAAGAMYIVLSILIWVVGRLFPSLGIIDLKISLRQILAARARGASTLLALVVGVFSLSLITLMAESVNNLMQQSLLDLGGNVFVSVPAYRQLETIESILNEQEGVNSYSTQLSYNMEFVEFEDHESGITLNRDDLIELAGRPETQLLPFVPGSPEERAEIQQEFLEGTLFSTSMDAVDVTSSASQTIIAGRDLRPDDAGMGVMVIPDNMVFTGLGITVGDTLVFRNQNPGILGGLQRGESIRLEVVGVAAANTGINMTTGYRIPADILPENAIPGGITIIADVEETAIADLRREMAAVPGAFVLETSIFTRLIDSLLGTFTIFPTLIAALGLIVGGVVIANSVALATMERRYEIAIMKAIGLQQERVLGILLLENGILGLIGGFLGVGWGMIGLLIFASQTDSLQAIPYGTALILMLMCVLIALVAALSSAWSASGEKPLNVLRYE